MKIAVYKKILSSIFLFALLMVSGLFLFSKDASAQTLTVIPRNIDCENNTVEFRATGIEPDTYRIRLWRSMDYRPILYEGSAQDPLVITRTFNIDGECEDGQVEIESGTYEARLHRLMDDGDWSRDDGDGDTVEGIVMSADGAVDPNDPVDTAPLWYDQSFNEWQARVYSRGNEQEIFGERYTAAQVQWVVYALAHQIMNMTGHGGIFACVSDPSNQAGNNIDRNCGGAIREVVESYNPGNEEDEPPEDDEPPDRDVVSTVETLFEPRAISFVTYAGGVRDRLVTLKLVPEAYAQQRTGFGFTAFNPVQRLWRNVRNATYLLLVIVIVIMAFMIMFRTKINPQTVISVQSALPKVIIALILITFSYAIAGLLVDIMYVAMGILAAILTGADGISDFSWVEMFGAMTDERNIISLIFYYFFSFTILFIVIMISVIGAIGLVLGLAASGGTAAIIFVVLLIILLLFLLLTAVRIIWLLIKTYVTILLLVIVAPVQILAGTVAPSAGFGSWLRNMAANLAVYPVVSGMFVISFVFMSGAVTPIERVIPGIGNIILPYQVAGAIEGDTTWLPPLSGGFNDADALLWLMASFAVIMLIPRAGDIIKSAIQGREFAAGTAIGAALGQLGGWGRSYGGFAADQIAQGNLPIPLLQQFRQRRRGDGTRAGWLSGPGDAAERGDGGGWRNRFRGWTEGRADSLSRWGEARRLWTRQPRGE